MSNQRRKAKQIDGELVSEKDKKPFQVKFDVKLYKNQTVKI